MKYYFPIFFLFGLSVYLIFLYRNETKLSTPYFRTNESNVKYLIPTYEIHNQSFISISSDRIEKLKKDYLSIWSTLDLLHNYIDIYKINEFCTEEYYKQLTNNYFLNNNFGLQRNSLTHHVNIMTISPDGLICSIIDSNLILKYSTPTFYYFDTINVAMFLFYQGENWRVDAIQVF